MRIATLGFHHESNTFAPVPATLERFLTAGPTEGDELVAQWADSQATIAGYLEAAAADPGVDIVPLIFIDLMPMGTITIEAFETLVTRMIERLEANGPWDAVLLALHGAAASEGHPDADGEILRRVRESVGPDVPIGITYDMHANVSERMISNATVVNIYMTNPHLDPRLRARQVGDLIIRTVRGEIDPVMELITPPLVINILRQGTSDEPMKGLVAQAHAAAERPGVLSVSIAEGFPYADVDEMGMAFLAVTDGDRALAREIASELAVAAWDLRHEMVGDGVDVDEALLTASRSEHYPVVLLDVGDNVGGGGPADSTHVLAAAQRLGIGGLFHSLCDPASVETCVAAGVGARVSLDVGAKTDDLHGRPVSIKGTVRQLDDGKFEDRGQTHGGKRFFDVGNRAVVYTDNDHTILLTTRPMGNISREELVSAGVDPSTQPIIVAKGVQSPRGAFEPIAAQMIQLNTGGCTSADLSSLNHERRRRPMFPFEPATDYSER